MNSHSVQASRGDLRAPPEKLAYTVDEMADALSMGRSTVYKLLAERKLKAVKYGVKTLILADSVLAFLASLEEAA